MANFTETVDEKETTCSMLTHFMLILCRFIGGEINSWMELTGPNTSKTWEWIQVGECGQQGLTKRVCCSSPSSYQHSYRDLLSDHCTQNMFISRLSVTTSTGGPKINVRNKTFFISDIWNTNTRQLTQRTLRTPHRLRLTRLRGEEILNTLLHTGGPRGHLDDLLNSNTFI